MKYIISLIYVMLFSILYADIKMDLFTQATNDFYEYIDININNPETILINPTKDSDMLLFENLFLSIATQKKKFKLIQKEDLKKLFEENIELNEHSFDQTKTPKLGKLIPPNFVLDGVIQYQEKRILLKPVYVLSFNLKINNIENGTTDLVFFKEYQKKWKPSIFLVLMIIAVFYVDLKIFNKLTKAYHAQKAFYVFIGSLVLILGWFYF